VRRTVFRRRGHLLGPGGEALHQLVALRIGQRLQRGKTDLGVKVEAAFGELAEHAGDARMGVLQVVDRVVGAFRTGEVDVELQVLLGRTCEVEEPRGIAAGFLDITDCP